MAGPGRTAGAERQRLDGRDRILAALSRLGPASRAELARRTRLAPSTVSSIVAELQRAGLVDELDSRAVPATGTRGGRPPILVALHRSAGVAVGIDLGRRHLRVAVSDLAHTQLAERNLTFTRDRDARDDIASAVALVAELLAEAGAERDQVVGVGMGLPGPVHRDTGELGDSTILPGWVGVTAATAMTEALGLPVTVDNDANLGAISEWMWGAGRDASELAYLKVGTGIGAGLIVAGRPYAGAGGTAGEIGHTVIDPAGPICRCGNRGCLEMSAGTGAVLDALRPTHGAGLTIQQSVRLARDGDAGCRRAITDAGHAIGAALATVCNLINPERVIVGGELGAAGEILLTPIRESLTRGTIRSAAADVTVLESALGDRAEVLGAVALALRSGTPLLG
ncbi:MAG: ROK family transcriptional regulator [Micromonosporaceae bacterium]